MLKNPQSFGQGHSGVFPGVQNQASISKLPHTSHLIRDVFICTVAAKKKMTLRNPTNSSSISRRNYHLHIETLISGISLPQW